MPGADGWATFTKVPAGDVKLIAPYAAPTPAADWQGFLEPDQTLQVELKMAAPNQLASVQALVVDASGNPVPGAYLKFDNNAATFVAQTRADGTTNPVSVLPGGSLTGYIYHPNWVGLTATNSVVPQSGGSYVLKAVLPARCVLTGKVTRPDGAPVARAYVALPPVYSDNNKNRLCLTNAQGLYTIANIPAGASYRLAAVGPELLTAVNVQIPVALTDTALSVDLTLPAVAHNTLSGTVYQPLAGSGQRIPTNATVQVYGSLPDIDPTGGGNLHWGLPQTVLVGGLSEGDMPPSRIGQFSIPNLPAGPYKLTASSSLFPSLVTMTGDFGTATAATSALDVFLNDNAVGLVQGKVMQADGQTPVAPGARVMVMVGAQNLIQVLTQPGGAYAFPKVIPPSSSTPYHLRVEDPQTGNVVVQPFTLKAQEVKTVNLRLWGTGDLTVNVQDSEGHPMLCAGAATCGTITLQHSKANLVSAGDLPLLALPLTPADRGTLLFPRLLEGLIKVQLKDPAGFSGLASVEIPVGGGNQTVTVRLQPVGRIQGTLVRADGTPVAAGRVDAYQGGRWLGTCPTFVQFPSDPAPVPGHFMFDPLPTGAIRLEAWDPDSRQTGEATVSVLADQTSTLTLSTLDTGTVTIQVLQEGQPVLRAGIDVAYRGGPALLNSVQATADENGQATFILPPGTYGVRATDPVSLASGTMSFTRELNAPAMSETLSIQPVRSVLVTALPPPMAPVQAPAQAQAPLNLAGWRIAVSGLNRAILLDSNNQGTLQEMPIGTYTLGLTDERGRVRGSQSFRVTADGGPLQLAEVQARAYGDLRVTVLDAGGAPVSGAAVNAGVGGSLFTDTAGQAVFYGIPQGSREVAATRGSQRAGGICVVSTEGELAEATLTFAPTAALHGVVRDPFGQPVPYVAVSCNAASDTATDQHGAYAFQGLPLGKSLTITARTAQGRIGVSAPLSLSQGDDPEVDLTLLAVGALRGQVTDPLRPTLPPLGLQVMNTAGQVLATSTTDQTGAFQLANLPAGQNLTLKILWDDGTTLAAQQAFTIAGEGQTTDLSVPLPPFVNITGWTLAASGGNLPMYVQLQDAQGAVLGNASTSMDIPTFCFRYLKVGQSYRLEGFQTGTHEAAALTVFTPSGQTLTEHYPLQVQVWSGLSLQLRYPDGSGAPGGTATAHIQGLGGLTAGRVWDVSFDAAGAAGLPSLPPGPVRIQVNALPWQGPVTVEATIPAQAGVFAVELPILGTGALELQLRYPDGSAAPGSGVQARIFQLGEGGTRAVTAAFDEHGRLLVQGLPLGSAQVTVSGLPWQGPVTFSAPLATQGLTLAQDVAVVGLGALRIRLHTTLVPGHDVTQATVAYLRGGQTFPMALQPDGTFQTAVPLGEPLQVQVTDYVVGKVLTQCFGALAQLGTSPTNVFGVPALGQVHGQVLGADGQPRFGVPVLLNDNGARLQAMASDGTGRYRFTGVEVSEPLTLVAQDPLIAPIPESITLSQEGQDLQQDFQLKGFASLAVHLTRADNGDAPGIQVALVGSGVSKQGTTDAAGQVAFTQVLPEVALNVTASFPSGSVSQRITLQSLQSATVELKETPRTHVSGRVRRQAADQTWPAGTTLQISGAASANLALNSDGTFADQELLLAAGTALQLTVSMPGLSLPLPGSVAGQPGAQTVLDQTAPGFGSLQASVALAGQPVPSASVWLDNHTYATDAQGLTAVAPLLLGIHRLQVSTKDGMAWADAQIQTDGQALVVPLALKTKAVALPANITLERLGLAVSTANTSWMPTLGLGIDTIAGVMPGAITPPPQGYWVSGGQSLAWEKDQGDIHLTRILSSAGYGLQDQWVFQNRGAVAHTLRLSALTGALHDGQNPQLGTASQTGGAWFVRNSYGSGSTVAWGRGAWVPTSLVASHGIYSGNDTLLWPALSLQPGQSYSIWLGYAPHGQGVTIASSGDKSVKVPNAPEAVARALQRMVGQAPEWLQNLDARLSNAEPAPTVTDTLPAWDGSASLNLIDPTGEPVQAMGATTTLTLNPKELLAPQTVVNWSSRSSSFRSSFLLVPPAGLSYVLATPTPLRGELAWGQALDLKLGQDWAVAQFLASANQSGNHALSLGDAQRTWSASETLKAGVGLRWTTQATGLTWTATEQDNSHITASGTSPLAVGALTPIQFQFPAYGSLLVQGPQSLGVSGYDGLRRLTATAAGKSLSSLGWSNGGFLFPALPVGTAQITGTWNLGTAQVQEGLPTTLPVLTGSLQVTALDVNGVKLSGSFQVNLTKDGVTNTFNSDSGYPSFSYLNPQTIGELPVGEYTVGLKDPASGVVVATVATISPGSTASVTLQLSQNGSLAVTLQYPGGVPVSNVWVSAAPTNGTTQSTSTNASGFAHFMNLGTGSASITYGRVPGADSADAPGGAPSLVPLVPGADVPFTLTVPKLGAVTIRGLTQAGDALPGGSSYSIANAFTPGRRWSSNASFQGVVLEQPLLVRFGDGVAYAPVEAPSVVPTTAGQTLTLTFPLGRLRVRLRRQDQSPLPSVRVVLSVPGASSLQYSYTDATGVATFAFVPIGALISCNATSAGIVQAASDVAFTGPDQLVELTFPATIPWTVHLRRSNPTSALSASGWIWRLTPGSDSGASLPVDGLDPVFSGLYTGTSQTVTATQYRFDSLSNASVGTLGSHNATWKASLSQPLGPSALETTLTLPVRASARLVFQDPQGQAFTGTLLKDTLTVTMQQSTNPALMQSGGTGTPPASRSFSSFAEGTLPEVFTEGTHVLSLRSNLWGALPDISFVVGPQDDGSQLQVPVVLDWLNTSYSLRAVAGDGQTPVPEASFQLKASGTSSTAFLGYLQPLYAGSALADTAVLQGKVYVPRGRQLQFSADYAHYRYNADGSASFLDTGWVDGVFHGAGDICNETMPLPLTAARARLTEPDGSDLPSFAAEVAPDRPLPMVQLQGVAYAIVLGAVPGPLSLTLYDTTSGLGLSAPMTVPPVGQAATLVKALPAYAWLSQATFQDVNLHAVPGGFLVGVSADSPGLVKPGLAQWTFGADWALNRWQSTAQVQPGDPIDYADPSSFDIRGFQPPQSLVMGASSPQASMPRVRVPLQGTLWAGAYYANPYGANPLVLPGPYASRAFSLNPGDTSAIAFQEPLRTWVNVPLAVTDGSANPYASNLLITPLSAPQGWSYFGFPIGTDTTGHTTLPLPQGESLRLEIAAPGGCGKYWYGFLDLTVPTPMPLEPIQLKATSQKGTACP